MVKNLAKCIIRFPFGPMRQLIQCPSECHAWCRSLGSGSYFHLIPTCVALAYPRAGTKMQSNPPIRVALVEDRPDERRRLALLIEGSPDFVCVAACGSARDELEGLPQTDPDIVLMDIELPGESGIDCVRRLRPLVPRAEFMMLTVVEDHERIVQAIKAGATGYAVKRQSPSLLEMIREWRAGGAPMSGQIARLIVAEVRKPTGDNHRPPVGDVALSPIEWRVLWLLGRGLLYKEVAEELEIKESTVRTHIWRIYRRLNVHNRTEALLKVFPRDP